MPRHPEIILARSHFYPTSLKKHFAFIRASPHGERKQKRNRYHARFSHKFQICFYSADFLVHTVNENENENDSPSNESRSLASNKE